MDEKHEQEGVEMEKNEVIRPSANTQPNLDRRTSVPGEINIDGKVVHTLTTSVDFSRSMHMSVRTVKSSEIQSRRMPRRASGQEEQRMRVIKSRVIKPETENNTELNHRERLLLRRKSVDTDETDDALVKRLVLDKLTQLDGPIYPIYTTNFKNELAFMVADSITDRQSSIAKLNEMGGVEGIAKLLCINLKKGIIPNSNHANKLTQTFGINRLPGARDADFIGLVLEALNDTMLLMLCIAAVISLVLGLIPATSDDPAHGWIEGTAILIAVSIVTLITAINDYKKALQFKKLNMMSTSNIVTVMRNGKEMEVNAYDVQMGDIISIDVGNKIPADGIYIEGENITCDESGSTGENEPMKKGNYQHNHKLSPFFLSGTSVLSGYGKFLVIAVGTSSFDGKLRMAIREGAEGSDGNSKTTPLQDKLNDLAEWIGKVGSWLAGLAFIGLLGKLIYLAIVNHTTGQLPTKIVNIFILCVTIVVVAVPEGLPLAVTIALAYALTKMVKQNNLVREMDACETMGGVTTICSDKTGTLTENKMTVSMGKLCNKSFDFIRDKDGNNVTEDLSILAHKFASQLDDDYVNVLNTSFALNTTCYEGINRDAKEGEPKMITQGGNPTEHALVRFANDSSDMNYTNRRKEFQEVTRIAFSSARKMMSTVSKSIRKQKDNKLIDYSKMNIFTKGAAEIVLTRCTKRINENAEIVPFTDDEKNDMIKLIEKLSESLLRPIGVCYKEVNDNDINQLNDALHGGSSSSSSSDNKDDNADKKVDEASHTYDIEEHMIWLGVTGIRDPLRKEVPAAVATCQAAGIRIIMVTGDNLGTAKAIARDCNIYKDGIGIAMEGKEFRNLSPEEMKKIIPKLCVLARSSPQDKQILVKAVQAEGEIVAVTGDGTNDGPALAMADVGFSMGGGTEVAKEASKIILLDNNFASVTTAVLWGRSVYDSIRCFLQFQLTVNVVAMAITLVGAFSDADGESPMSAVMLLWVNLIMDTFAALALATQPPSDKLMSYAPIVKGEQLINDRMKLFVGIQGTFQLIVNFIVLYVGHIIFDIPFMSDIHRTLVFNVFVLCQIFNEINARKVHRGDFNVFGGLVGNWWFLSVMLFSITLQFLMVQVFGRFAGTHPLTGVQWVFCLGLAALSLPLGVVVNIIGMRIPEKMAVNALERLKDDNDLTIDVVNEKKDDEHDSPSKIKKNQVAPEEQQPLL